MSFKQPRVPEFRGGESTESVVKRLILFLRGFCMAVWKADNQRAQEIERLKKRLDELTGGE
jgi:hypothetical protein